jgi:peptidoglycan/xylan/chitin deacetylase (PgdA/CDA1 family)
MKRLLRCVLTTPGYIKNILFPVKGVTILTYHHITDDLPPGPMAVPVKRFSDQMHYLSDHGYLVIGLDELPARLKDEGAADSPTVCITFDDGWSDNHTNACPILAGLGFKAGIFLTTGEIGKSKQYLTMDQIKEMAGRNIVFGAHTVTHPWLTQLSLERAQQEVEQSLRFIQKQVSADESRKVPFCYPYGDFDQQTKHIVEQAGASCAVSEKPGKNTVRTCIFELRRTEMSGQDTLFDFKKKLIGAYDWLHRLNQKWSTLRRKGK